MVREMITRYGRSPGGYIWAILEPAGMVAVLAIAFSQFIKAPPLGESFILFYATGYIPFHAYAEIASTTSNSVNVNRALMQFPVVTPVDAVIARFLLSFLTVIVVSVLIFGTLIATTDDQIRLQIGTVFTALAVAAVLGCGAGALNAVLFAFLPMWQRIWIVINRPLFIISGVFYTFESLPSNVQSILWWNPIVHIVGAARSGFYPVYRGDYVTLGYPLALGVAGFVIGGALLMRHRSYVIELH